MIDLDQVLRDVDDFNAEFEPRWKEQQLLQARQVKRCRESKSAAE